MYIIFALIKAPLKILVTSAKVYATKVNLYVAFWAKSLGGALKVLCDGLCMYIRITPSHYVIKYIGV